MYKKINSITWYLILGILFFFVIQRIALNTRSSFIETIASTFLYPVLLAQHTIVTPLVTFYSTQKTIHALETTIATLKQTQKKLLAEVIALHSIVWFTKNTEELIAFKERYRSENMILGHIILKHFSEQEHFFLIDQGSTHGVTVDMVAVYKNCLVGRVTHTYPYYSKITLITDKSCKVAACSPTTKACGISQGCNNVEELRLNYVSHLAKVKMDDLIISNGEGLIFPAGFAVGAIKTCAIEGLCYHITLKPLLDLSTLEYCYVLQK